MCVCVYRQPYLFTVARYIRLLCQVPWHKKTLAQIKTYVYKCVDKQKHVENCVLSDTRLLSSALIQLLLIYVTIARVYNNLLLAVPLFDFYIYVTRTKLNSTQYAGRMPLSSSLDHHPRPRRSQAANYYKPLKGRLSRRQFK